MSVDKPSTYRPALRFPDFRDSPDWLAPPLADLYNFKRTNTLSRDKLNYEAGTIRNIHYGDIHTKFKPLFRVADEYVPYVNPDVAANGFDDDAFCEEGDIVLVDASEDLDDVGKAIEVVSLDGERVVSGTHTILATRRGKIPVVGFAGQLFQSAAVRAGIKKEAQGAKVYGISANRISTVALPIPSTEAEQQKISDCLGTLDDLITAEHQKLKALQRHKRGLMQQLFPKPGKTIPGLRFPEFGNEAPWKIYPLGTFIQEYRQKSTSQDEFEVLTSARSGLVRQKEYYDNDRITGRDNVGFNVIPPNHITYRSRSDNRHFYFNENTLGITGIVSTYYPVFRIKGGSNKFFVGLFSHHADLVGKYSVGTSQTVLSLNELRRIQLPIPHRAEQEKIALCMTTIDDQLDAQARRLDKLKLHKKGMMQQLFPSPESSRQ